MTSGELAPLPYSSGGPPQPERLPTPDWFRDGLVTQTWVTHYSSGLCWSFQNRNPQSCWGCGHQRPDKLEHLVVIFVTGGE